MSEINNSDGSRDAYRAYVVSKIQQGLEDIEAGRVVDAAEVDRRMAQLGECADEATQARIDELADKCTEGTLTTAERREYEALVAAIEVITVRQARRRRAERV